MKKTTWVYNGTIEIWWLVSRRSDAGPMGSTRYIYRTRANINIYRETNDKMLLFIHTGQINDVWISLRNKFFFLIHTNVFLNLKEQQRF